MRKKNVAVITGASGGLGAEFARVHAKEGGDLVLIARDYQKLESLRLGLEDYHDISVTLIVKDLTEPNAAKEVFEDIMNKKIKVDILINNAGFGGHGKFNERDLETEKNMIQLNISALTEMTHYFANHMIKNGGGKILNVSSTASLLPGPLQAVYYATKAYVTSFSQALAEELKDKNITVTTFCPGAVATGFVKTGKLKGVKLFDNAKPSYPVAVLGYKGMMEGKLLVFNEKKLSFLLNWIIPLLPRWVVLKISRRLMEKED